MIPGKVVIPAPPAVLSVIASPKGDGTTIPSGSASYPPGAMVTCTATAALGFGFDHWEVDGVSQGAGTNPINVTMNANHLAVAYFNIPVGGGSFSGATNPIPNPSLNQPTITTISTSSSITLTPTTPAQAIGPANPGVSDALANPTVSDISTSQSNTEALPTPTVAFV
jgi:hypothetical protein